MTVQGPRDRDISAPPEDGYDGPAALLDGDSTAEVTVILRGHFDPIAGSYSWYGRVAPSPSWPRWSLAAPFAVLATVPDEQG